PTDRSPLSGAATSPISRRPSEVRKEIGERCAGRTVLGRINSAIPVSLVKKIADDLLEFGQVQRGLLGVQIADVTAELADDEKLDVVQGVFIRSVNSGSAAEAAGIETGDVIQAINQHLVAGVSEMQEWVARHRPGQTIEVTYRRAGQSHTVKTVLKKIDGSQELKRLEAPKPEGIELEDLTYGELNQLNLDQGIRVKSVEAELWKKSGLSAGFVVTHLDKVPVDSIDDFYRMLQWKRGGVLLEGISQNGQRGTFAIDLP
ncbi:MAG: PDZ domain-containing protein, partial [Bacteroidota bacterium]